ncbi:uncharacterized protein ANIA_11522 [Aspergillus nidulans FGSC A4]|uniref:Uncharacterized protein n=1 Tax=Emericella nidulans (strain FGSC A4 / ATCC 38163 / CBS 112.46 / NRRL 194 / M139) TaxID=227321 RepID=C8V0W7_EMENI|nr:hypothetical protein [Aspergillus nidulans FGSC A4]CBF71032.1 TPA: hypothetical protein ANIA_11522 [Aspergillus nidulans FGSC A4]
MRHGYKAGELALLTPATARSKSALAEGVLKEEGAMKLGSPKKPRESCRGQGGNRWGARKEPMIHDDYLNCHWVFRSSSWVVSR